jgi:hypothetical protein
LNLENFPSERALPVNYYTSVFRNLQPPQPRQAMVPHEN